MDPSTQLHCAYLSLISVEAFGQPKNNNINSWMLLASPNRQHLLDTLGQSKKQQHLSVDAIAHCSAQIDISGWTLLVSPNIHLCVDAICQNK
jgi:hypothetical protein